MECLILVVKKQNELTDTIMSINGFEVISLWDLVLVPIYLIVIYFVAYRVKVMYIYKYPEYRYFQFLFVPVHSRGGVGVTRICMLKY